jgi:hypothetical protein
VNGDHRFELPEELSVDEERAIIAALERYFLQENPHPHPWVLAGRLYATGYGALQARRYVDHPWGTASRHPVARPGVAPMLGRGDST